MSLPFCAPTLMTRGSRNDKRSGSQTTIFHHIGFLFCFYKTYLSIHESFKTQKKTLGGALFFSSFFNLRTTPIAPIAKAPRAHSACPRSPPAPRAAASPRAAWEAFPLGEKKPKGCSWGCDFPLKTHQNQGVLQCFMLISVPNPR